jgi:hypothetical protein
MRASKTRITQRIHTALVLGACLAAFSLLAIAVATPSFAHDDPTKGSAPDPDHDTNHNRPEHGSLANIGQKLSDPTANIWALQFNIQAPTFSDGDLNTGNPKVGGNVVFQPVLPFPLYGTGENQWKMITRPIIPIIFAQQIPKGFNDFKHVGGIGDIEIPLLLNPPERMIGHWILGAGPVFEFPTSTNDALGAQQYSIGPAVVVGYKSPKWTAALFPNYFFGVGDRSDRKSTTKTTSKLSLLYAFTYELGHAWQVGFNPTISYNNKALPGNKWDVPVGLFAAKTIKVGRLPVKIQGGLEYSVVSPDAFGKRLAFRLVMTPVIPGLVKNPIFGGK